MNVEHPKSKYPIPDHAKKVFEGQIFDVFQWEQEMYDGSTHIFEKLTRTSTVVVVPILEDGKILMTEEEQPGRAKYMSTPGGRMDPGEDVLDTAKRELLEETGYEADEFIFWSSEQPVSKIEWSFYTIIAKGLKKVSEPHLDAGEKISLKPVSFEEFLDFATDPAYGERKLMSEIYEAKLNPEKMEELKKLFSPKR